MPKRSLREGTRPFRAMMVSRKESIQVILESGSGGEGTDPSTFRRLGTHKGEVTCHHCDSKSHVVVLTCKCRNQPHCLRCESILRRCSCRDITDHWNEAWKNWLEWVGLEEKNQEQEKSSKDRLVLKCCSKILSPTLAISNSLNTCFSSNCIGKPHKRNRSREEEEEKIRANLPCKHTTTCQHSLLCKDSWLIILFSLQLYTRTTSCTFPNTHGQLMQKILAPQSTNARGQTIQSNANQWMAKGSMKWTETTNGGTFS